jgi:cellulose biosynthesis protein BcsQ
MGNVIAVSCLKGGVGNTVTAISLATGLARKKAGVVS